jgi:hypothetical protein
MYCCLQCSRFHPLTEFDGERKNCRQRLQQHNRRQRRKRLLRRPDGSHYDSNNEEELYQIPDTSKAAACVATDVAAAFNTEPYPQYLAPESPDLSEIAQADGIMLSSADLDSLFGPYVGQTDEHRIDERLLLEISSAVISAAEACGRLAAEDAWADQWYRPALGHSDVAPAYFGGSAPRPGDLY